MRQWRGASPSQKNRRRAVIYVSTGLARLPRDPMSTHHYRRRAVIYVSTGLARLPRDTGGTRTTAEERLYKHTTRHMHSRQRRVTPNNPIRTTHTAEGAWGIVPLWEMRFEDALLPIRRQIKTAEERFHMLARGWLAYPVTPVAHALPPKSGCIKKKWNPASRWIPSLKKSYTPYFVNFKTVLSLNFNT